MSSSPAVAGQRPASSTTPTPKHQQQQQQQQPTSKEEVHALLHEQSAAGANNNGSSNGSNGSNSNYARDAVDPQRALQLMLVEMRDRAQYAEGVLKDLTIEITRAETEIAQWKEMMSKQDKLDLEAEKDPLTAFLSGIAVGQKRTVGRSVNADMANAAQRFADAESKIRDLKAQEELLTGELERDRWDKMRMLKMVDIFMMGRSAPTAGETVTFAKFGNAKSEALMRVVRALPTQNVQLVERQGVFKCITGILTAAMQQHRRYGFVDLERVCSHGVRYTGTSLGLSVIHDEMSEDDFLRL